MVFNIPKSHFLSTPSHGTSPYSAVIKSGTKIDDNKNKTAIDKIIFCLFIIFILFI